MREDDIAPGPRQVIAILSRRASRRDVALGLSCPIRCRHRGESAGAVQSGLRTAARSRRGRSASDSVAVLDSQAMLFDQRVHAGRVIEAHGDLRPEHICLEPDPQIIDCLEFSLDFRLLDSADELAFLSRSSASGWARRELEEHNLHDIHRGRPGIRRPTAHAFLSELPRVRAGENRRMALQRRGGEGSAQMAEHARDYLRLAQRSHRPVRVKLRQLLLSFSRPPTRQSSHLYEACESLRRTEARR